VKPLSFRAIEPGLEVSYIFLDQIFASLSFELPGFEGTVGKQPQRVEIIDVHSIQTVDFRIDIAWYGKIDNKQGAVPASAQNRAEFLHGHERVRCRSRTH
jgi:hypothetical protein